MKKFRLFIENFLVYGLGGTIGKIVPLIMVPIVTRLMPDPSYYGISDLSNTLISFASALAVLGMYDAMYRMYFEKDEEDFKKRICSTALAFTLCTSLLVFLLMIFFRGMIARWFFSDRKYAYLVYISAAATLVTATNNLISAPTRMQNKRRVFVVTNTLTPLLSYSISIPLLLRGYYIIALPLAIALSGFTIEAAFFIMNRKWFRLSLFDRSLLRPLLSIAIPLFPNFLIYWVFNSSDKLMITNLMNVGAAGIYSIGAKLGQVSQLIYAAFAGGWQYFAFSTMKEENQVESNSRVFEYLGVISFSASIFIAAFSYFLYRLLFAGDYVEGFIVAPYLFLAPLLQMLFQVAANQFLVVKKTWPNMLILSGGAAANILLNFLLIPRIGIEGAAIATLCGYIISDLVCCLVLIRMKLMKIRTRFLLSCLLLLLSLLIWRIFFHRNVFLGLAEAVLCASLYLFLYREDIGMLLRGMKKEAGKRE